MCLVAFGYERSKSVEMSFMHPIFLLGFFIAFATLAVAIPPPLSFEKAEGYAQCENRTNVLIKSIGECVNRQFLDAEMSQTGRRYDRTKCLRCIHICRKKSEIFQCVRQGTEAMANISGKASTMAPFFSQFVETFISGLCEDRIGLLPASNGDDKQCFRRSMTVCHDHLNFLNYLHLALVCEAANPNNDPYTKKYICEKMHDHLECTGRSIKKCSPELMGPMEVLKNKTMSFEPCMKYY
ncbi:uncharacterized protein LOC124154388 [Ischnura elegans]|uniref:uncharacterized protein LOC124154388 n=1 Tax=Ischnura elegans TaxID=197161 RepID=UPI001ED88151|nr:uncharacterized protein LOC124154388 [Ischnura elegans]